MQTVKQPTILIALKRDAKTISEDFSAGEILKLINTWTANHGKQIEAENDTGKRIIINESEIEYI